MRALSPWPYGVCLQMAEAQRKGGTGSGPRGRRLAEPAPPAPGPGLSALLHAAWNGVFSVLPFLFSLAVARVDSWFLERRPHSQRHGCDGQAWHRRQGLQSNALVYDGQMWRWGWGFKSSISCLDYRLSLE